MTRKHNNLLFGAFLLNVGHIPEEIDVASVRELPTREALPFVEEVSLEGKQVYLLSGGSMFNLTAGAGDSFNAFDVTLAVFCEALGFLVGERATYARWRKKQSLTTLNCYDIIALNYSNGEAKER